MAHQATAEGLERLRLLELAMEQSYHAVVITDADLVDGPHIVFVNKAFEAMTGYGREEIQGQTPRILQGPDTEREVLQRLRGALERGEAFEGETVNYRRDGTPYEVRWNVTPVHANGSHDEVTHFVSVQQDVTERRRLDAQVRLLSTALEEASDPVLITDASAMITYVNQAFETVTGYPRDEILGRNPRILQSGVHDPATYAEMWDTLKRGETFRAELVDRCRDGSLVHLEQTITPVRDVRGRTTHYVSIGRDVTERSRMEGEIRRMANTDWLTGIANRLSLGNTLESEIERSRRYGRPLSLIMFDVDAFKALNDEFGHEAGDEVLRRLARTVSGLIRDADALSRWGGEEFMVVVPEADAARAGEVAEKLRRNVAAMELPGLPTVTASFGVTELQADDNAKTLVRRVDEAMYQAKEGGRNRVVVL